MNGTRNYFLRTAFFAPFGVGFGRLAAGLAVVFALWLLLVTLAAGRGAGLAAFVAFDALAGTDLATIVFAGVALTGFAGTFDVTAVSGRGGGTGLPAAE